GGFFDGAIFVRPEHDVLATVGEEFHGAGAFILHALTHSVTVYLAAAGALVAWFLYLKRPELPGVLLERLAVLHKVLVNKYYFDWVNENVIARATRGVGRVLWRVGDQLLIDGLIVNGSARAVGVVSSVARGLQSGYLYHYAFAMVIALAVLIGWFALKGSRDGLADPQHSDLAADLCGRRRARARLGPSTAR